MSSIGDIVLTTPVIRCLKMKYPEAEIHFLVKPAYSELLEPNPHITRLHILGDSLRETAARIRAERYDHIVDIHKNLRTFALRLMLLRRFHSFPKLNFRKWIAVKTKRKVLPDIHIVDRYLRAVAFLDVKNDGKGLDFFIPADLVLPAGIQGPLANRDYIVMVVGAKQQTKQIPEEKMLEIVKLMNVPLVLIGGPDDADKAKRVAAGIDHIPVLHTCGLLNILQSALLIRGAKLIITGDTGMMHIAAALKKPVISLWGNTIPAFGMTPYYPMGMEHLSHILEVSGLSCRPCSKLGYDRCPKKHFRCMNDIETAQIRTWL